MVLQAAPSSRSPGKVVSSGTFGSTVRPGGRTYPRSTQPAGTATRQPVCKRSFCPEPLSSAPGDRSSDVKDSGQRPPSPPGWSDFALKVSLLQKMGPWLTCTPHSEPLPAAQHAVTTTGAYVETTFPFKISAGAMSFTSQLATMENTRTGSLTPLTGAGYHNPRG